MKVAVIVLADPGRDESLGRVYNALEAVTEFKKSGDDVKLYFDGAGTRWLSELADVDHPAHGFYEEAKDAIAGACSGCAAVFDADKGENDALLEALSSTVSYRDILVQGYQILTF